MQKRNLKIVKTNLSIYKFSFRVLLDAENDAITRIKNRKHLDQGSQLKFKTRGTGKKKWKRKKKTTNTS